jgi:hypothetical protein
LQSTCSRYVYPGGIRHPNHEDNGARRWCGLEAWAPLPHRLG